MLTTYTYVNVSVKENWISMILVFSLCQGLTKVNSVTLSIYSKHHIGQEKSMSDQIYIQNSPK